MSDHISTIYILEINLKYKILINKILILYLNINLKIIYKFLLLIETILNKNNFLIFKMFFNLIKIIILVSKINFYLIYLL